ncbi:hypothetical protein L573_1079 [Bordetella holmesii H620]|nr:hypothetical protein L573_1079 [Bordetella holmesii H620]
MIQICVRGMAADLQRPRIGHRPAQAQGKAQVYKTSGLLGAAIESMSNAAARSALAA